MNTQDWQYGEGGEYLSQDFKQCQRSDNTYYGVPDTSECAMKGAKEVSQKAGTGLLGKPGKVQDVDSAAEQAAQSGVNPKQQDKIAKSSLKEAMAYIGKSTKADLEHTLEKFNGGRIDELVKLAERDHRATGRQSSLEVAKKNVGKVIVATYLELAKREKQEGKKAKTITSYIKAETLSKIGVSADKLNVAAQDFASMPDGGQEQYDSAYKVWRKRGFGHAMAHRKAMNAARQ